MIRANKKGYPTRCLRCGKAKGSRAFTCVKCFAALHPGDTDGNGAWASLMLDWHSGKRDFPRPDAAPIRRIARLIVPGGPNGDDKLVDFDLDRVEAGLASCPVCSKEKDAS